MLIPTYNYVRYLPEAIESVLEQDWRDLELLISDDCSTDGSGEVIAQYAAKDSRIRFQIHPTNLGMVQNWNWCLSEARGEYIKFLFGDDKLACPQALGKLLQLLAANTSVALAASARYVIGEHSEVLETWDHFCTPGVHSSPEVIARCLEEDRNLIGEPSAVLFRRRDAARAISSLPDPARNTTGISEPDFLISMSISKPVPSGSFISRMARSNSLSFNRISLACFRVCATTILQSAIDLVKPLLVKSASLTLSSTSKMFIIRNLDQSGSWGILFRLV